MLLAFFELNKKDEFARDYLYEEIPLHYIFEHGVWRDRKRNIKVLSRLYNVSTKNTELFCLRQLLRYIRGPTCFEDVRTHEGIVHETFRECAVSMGLFKDDM